MHLPSVRHVSLVVIKLGVLPAVVPEVKAIQTAAAQMEAILIIHADLLVVASAVKGSAVMTMTTARLIMSQTVRSETQEVMATTARAVIRTARQTMRRKMTKRDASVVVTGRTRANSDVAQVQMVRRHPYVTVMRLVLTNIRSSLRSTMERHLLRILWCHSQMLRSLTNGIPRKS